MESQDKPYVRDAKTFKFIPAETEHNSAVVYLNPNQVIAINRLMYGIKKIEQEIERIITHRDFGDELLMHSLLSQRAKNIIAHRIDKPYHEIMLSDVGAISSKEWLKCRNLGKKTLNNITSYLHKQGIQYR